MELFLLMTYFTFDRDKFRELLVYIASECADDRHYGDTFVNKVLFFSDAFALQHLGEPITGARYQKLPFGPGAVALLPFRREMEADGDVMLEKAGTAPYERTVTVALRDPDLSLFTEDEVELVDEVIQALRGHTAAHVSELSHMVSPGWNLMEEREDIPLETQFISQKEPPPEVLERGRELAARFGW